METILRSSLKQQSTKYFYDCGSHQKSRFSSFTQSHHCCGGFGALLKYILVIWVSCTVNICTETSGFLLMKVKFQPLLSSSG